MRCFLDAEVNGSCGALISVALVPEDMNLAPISPTGFARTSCQCFRQNGDARLRR
jgi:hypothetical protein